MAEKISIIKNGKSNYIIIIPVRATKLETAAASILQEYLQKISGVNLPIKTDDQRPIATEISVGNTNRIPANISTQKIKENGFLFKTIQQKLFILGAGNRGVLNGVYTFLEEYLDCKKLSDDVLEIPNKNIIEIPDQLNDLQNPVFDFRQDYFPDAMNAKYMDWYKLNDFADFWGLWGHSFFKLVPPEKYFSSHPEYYALVNGKRQATQLCLSNDAVVKIVVNDLRARMKKNPDALYWSVSQNDGGGYCQCDKCKKINEAEGGPQGSLIAFVNKVAAYFPDKIITTLAYNYSQHAPLHIKPAKNVCIILSDINCERNLPIETDPKSAGFRKDLRDWSRICNGVMIWDYVVQFTNYMSPFPNLQTLGPNMRYFQKQNIKGLFVQGSGEDKSVFCELRSYLIAHLLWRPDADVNELTKNFLNNYYGAGGKYIGEYIHLMQTVLQRPNQSLDIYGNPVSAHASWLSPELISQYSALFDSAEKATENNPAIYNRVELARQPLEFAVLQLARFYGMDKNGMFVRNDNGKWIPKPGLENRIHRFTEMCGKNNITHLSEDGLTPQQYEAEWMKILTAGVADNLALQKNVELLTKANEDYPAKGAATLTDGIRGMDDFSYNWLGWYGNNMQVQIDLGKEEMIHSVTTGFLEDQRHWIFPPQQMEVEISQDGKTFTPSGNKTNPPLRENYTAQTINDTLQFNIPVKARYIRITAINQKKLPPWHNHPTKKPFLFADEIVVY